MNNLPQAIQSTQDRFRCYYCDRQFGKFARRTKDHIIPKSKGGNGSSFNILLCCRFCNQQKGNQSVDQFKISVLLNADYYFSMTGITRHLFLSRITTLQKYIHDNEYFLTVYDGHKSIPDRI